MASKFTVECPHCQHEFIAREEEFEQGLNCPSCDGSVKRKGLSESFYSVIQGGSDHSPSSSSPAQKAKFSGISKGVPHQGGLELKEGCRMGANGRYLILEKIGAGGMGAVWRAKDDLSALDYAIKVIPPDLSRSDYGMEEIKDNFSLVQKRTAMKIAQPSLRP